MFWKDFLLNFFSLKSPHGGKPPLAPLTDRNKPAVWAATPREAGWIVCLFHVRSHCKHAWNHTNLDNRFRPVRKLSSLTCFHKYIFFFLGRLFCTGSGLGTLLGLRFADDVSGCFWVWVEYRNGFSTVGFTSCSLDRHSSSIAPGKHVCLHTYTRPSNIFDNRMGGISSIARVSPCDEWIPIFWYG